MKAYELLAQLLAYQGDMQKSAEAFQAEYQIALAHGLSKEQLALEEKLGVAEMRRGETENCVAAHGTMSCIVPLCAEAQHKRTSGSTNATVHFLKYLSQDPQDLEVKWLLNLAYMTLGKYPQGVPQEHLIPPSVFRSEKDIGQFVDVAPMLGVNTTDPWIWSSLRRRTARECRISTTTGTELSAIVPPNQDSQNS